MSRWRDDNDDFTQMFYTPEGTKIIYDLITGPILNRLVADAEMRLARGDFSDSAIVPTVLLIIQIDLNIFYPDPGRLAIQFTVEAHLGVVKSDPTIATDGHILPVLTPNTLIRLNGRLFKKFGDFKELSQSDQAITKLAFGPDQQSSSNQLDHGFKLNISEIEQWLKVERDKKPKDQGDQNTNI